MIPDGVEVKLDDGLIVVKGNKHELSESIHRCDLSRRYPARGCFRMKLEDVDGGKAVIIEAEDLKDKECRAMWGTMRALVANMIQGVSEGFFKQLEVVGVGYKVNMKGNDVVFEVGYSHPVEFKVPEGVEVKIEKNTVTVSGYDKQAVGEVAAQMRKIRKPEPYKGKGIRYSDEQVRRKAGKAAKTGE